MNQKNTDLSRIRNFAIIAHIDHGKSTIADRLMEITNTITSRESKNQLLDSMDIERERGITIKAQTVCMSYKAKDGITYSLNLIDTPGHVDFSYEVSRSLAACEGAILIVDASQGVEAQTLANVLLANSNGVTIIPVLNKIDLPSARLEEVKDEIENELAIDTSDAICCSAKTGEGIIDILEAIVTRLPSPSGLTEAPLKALIFDSWYDAYLGIVTLVKVINGTISKGQRVEMMATGLNCEILNTGIFSPKMKNLNKLSTGEVGFIITGVKKVSELKIGDTVTDDKRPTETAFPGFVEVKPMVFCGIFPTDTVQYPLLKEALERLSLNDSSISFEHENSTALGFGFRCGFLGLLHMEIIQERLEREYALTLIMTAPTAVYRVTTTSNELLIIENPNDLPEPQKIKEIQEPIVQLTIFTPSGYVGNILKLCNDRRGIQTKMDFMGANRVHLEYAIPLSEVVLDFHDKLKSMTKGYASMDYEITGYQAGNLAKVDFMINGERVDALSVIIDREKSAYKGREICKKIKANMSRHQFQIAIQAAIGGKIISRETLGALRKDVTAKCYGGDISRKRKLLEKQKAGKKRMKMIGKVELPQDAFLAILKSDDAE